jgi:DNA invertase Pin-like site-specific DNA recombinase
MKPQAVIYIRVSSEKQAGDDKVSLDQQLADCRALCEAQGFTIAGIFKDSERYTKTKAPYKGKVVQPSGRYDDRPGFVQMLNRIEAGDIDAVVYWDNYRLGRHYRVLGTLANSLDIGGQRRNGRGDIQLWEASKRAMISRIVLGIMISIAQEENESRTRRVKMGKLGTLEQGRWPGNYKRYGYQTVKEPGSRGVSILLHPVEAEAVRYMFDLADRGHSLVQIRDRLIARGISQKEGVNQPKIRDWSTTIIGSILRSRDYTGQATYSFSDGNSFTVEIPQIIDPGQWQRVQQKLTERIQLSSRNTKTTWAAVQHLAYCGECDGRLTMYTNRYVYARNTAGDKVRYEFDLPKHTYACGKARRFKGEIAHAKVYHYGPSLDYSIWRHLVDQVIKHPELIREQVMNRRTELIAQGDDYAGEIARAQRELAAIEEGRGRLMAQLSKGTITEDDFERVMIQRNKDRVYWQEEVNRLLRLRDDVQQLENDLEYAYRLLDSYGNRLKQLDIPPAELNTRDLDERIAILTERKRIIQSLCEKVIVFADGRVIIKGL